MASRKKKAAVAGEIRPIDAYQRIGWECRRCSVIFISPSGPEPFCESCRATLEKQSKPCPGSAGGDPHGHVFYVVTGMRFCHYCDRPVDRPETPVNEEMKR